MSYEAPVGGPPAADATPKKKSKTPLVLGIVAAVIVLCCGGGALALYAGGDSLKDAASDAASAAASEAANDLPASVDDVKTGQCITLEGTDDNPVAEPVECTDPKAYTVLLRKEGTTDEAACKGTDYTEIYAMDIVGETRGDYILCVKPVAGSPSPSA